MSEELDEKRLGKFARSLTKSTTKWIANDFLWSAFASAFPTLAQSADQRRYFLQALESLAQRDSIELPSRTGLRWDRSFEPAVPTSVYVRREERAKPKEWRAFPWHEKLAWVSDIVHIAPETEKFLLRVHDGFTKNEFAEVTPLKYRSLQLTGDEKRLGELAKSTLFGNGRLTLDLLGCLTESPPLAFEKVGSRSSIIIFENSDSFSVARNVLRERKSPPYGYVGFGGGNGIAKSLPYLKQIEPAIVEIVYVGDLDVLGLKIAIRAARTAAAFELPAVQSASELHTAMLQSAVSFGQPDGWPDTTNVTPSKEQVDEVIQFVSTDTVERVSKIILMRRRIPEEVLGPAEMIRAWESFV